MAGEESFLYRSFPLIFCIHHYRDIQSADTTGITGRSPVARAFYQGWAQDQKAPVPGVAPDMGHGRIARFFARYCLQPYA
jgi:hypothetical protein